MTEPISNGLLSPNNVTDNIHDDEVNPSQPSSETVEKVEEILDRVESYNSVIPDSVTKSILESSGLSNPDPAVTRLISIAAQKFISDISYEALQHCKMRGGGKDQKGKGSGKDRKYGMATEDVVVALADQGVNVKKPPYHTNQDPSSDTMSTVKVKKLGVSFSTPSIIIVYESDGRCRKREMPLRDLTRDTNCQAEAKRLKKRHFKYLECVSDIRLEKMVVLAREHIRGRSLQDGLASASKELTVNMDGDLNKMNDSDLKRQKQLMDITFEKNSIGKDHPDFVYDKQIEFQPGSKKAEWDSSDDELEDKIEAPTPIDTAADSDDFW